MRTALSEMDHQQPPTPVAAYNTATNNILNGMAKQKSRVINMRFYWVRDRIRKTISTFSGRRVRKIQRIMS